MSPPTSPGSADLISGCIVPGCVPSACARRTSGDAACLPCGSQASPSPMTSVTVAISENQRGELRTSTISPSLSKGGGKPGSGYTLISSLAASPAKTGVSPANEPESPAPAPASSSTGHSESQSSLFDQPGSCSRTSRDSYPLTAGETLGPSSGRWPTSGMAWRGGYSTRATSECPSDAVECSLSGILVENPDLRYALSSRAASGILRRASARGRDLPDALRVALERLASS